MSKASHAPSHLNHLLQSVGVLFVVLVISKDGLEFLLVSASFYSQGAASSTYIVRREEAYRRTHLVAGGVARVAERAVQQPDGVAEVEQRRGGRGLAAGASVHEARREADQAVQRGGVADDRSHEPGDGVRLVDAVSGDLERRDARREACYPYGVSASGVQYLFSSALLHGRPDLDQTRPDQTRPDRKQKNPRDLLAKRALTVLEHILRSRLRRDGKALERIPIPGSQSPVRAPGG